MPPSRWFQRPPMPERSLRIGSPPSNTRKKTSWGSVDLFVGGFCCLSLVNDFWRRDETTPTTWNVFFFDEPLASKAFPSTSRAEGRCLSVRPSSVVLLTLRGDAGSVGPNRGGEQGLTCYNFYNRFCFVSTNTRHNHKGHIDFTPSNHTRSLPPRLTQTNIHPFLLVAHSVNPIYE